MIIKCKKTSDTKNPLLAKFIEGKSYTVKSFNPSVEGSYIILDERIQMSNVSSSYFDMYFYSQAETRQLKLQKI